MDDVIQTISSGVGLTLLGLASIIFWRFFRYLEKDRDYWRAQALDRLHANEDTLHAAETMTKPLLAMKKATAKGVPDDRRVELLKQITDLLLGGER